MLLGGLNSSGVLDISEDGEVAKFQPATPGEYTLVSFNSKVNSGSDQGFILVQDKSANSPGTSGEDLRMTIGVHNDFRSSTSHSDELWFQAGGRLCYNVVFGGVTTHIVPVKVRCPSLRGGGSASQSVFWSGLVNPLRVVLRILLMFEGQPVCTKVQEVRHQPQRIL